MQFLFHVRRVIERSTPAAVTASVGLLLAIAILSLHEAFLYARTEPRFGFAAGLVGFLSLAGAASTCVLLCGKLGRLQKGLESLRGSAEIFRLLFENAVDAALLLDDEGRCL